MSDAEPAIKLVQPAPNEHLIELLEDLLERAEIGEITAISVFFMDWNKEYDVSTSGFRNQVEALGALQIIKDASLTFIKRS